MVSDKSLVQLTEHIYNLSLPTNIGIIALPGKDSVTDIHLIDSGNDENSAALILDFLSKKFGKFNLKTIINTHSHADHCGGNTFLKKATGCCIMASTGEAALMECPDLECGLIWGGNPVNELKTSYFVAPQCKVDKTFFNTDSFYMDSVKIQSIPLNGHYIDQTGFLITDTDKKSVCFAGDALSGRNVIRKYWIQYLFDEKLSKESLKRLSEVKADFYIPGHGKFVTQVEGLVELNMLALLETENMILDELKTPKTSEQVLKAVADRNEIKLGISQYVLIGCTLRSYLSSLYDEGKIKYELKDNVMYWSLS